MNGMRSVMLQINEYDDDDDAVSHTERLLTRYLTNRLWEFTRFTNEMQLGTEMNSLDF